MQRDSLHLMELDSVDPAPNGRVLIPSNPELKNLPSAGIPGSLNRSQILFYFLSDKVLSYRFFAVLSPEWKKYLWKKSGQVPTPIMNNSKLAKTNQGKSLNFQSSPRVVNYFCELNQKWNERKQKMSTQWILWTSRAASCFNPNYVY